MYADQPALFVLDRVVHEEPHAWGPARTSASMVSSPASYRTLTAGSGGEGAKALDRSSIRLRGHVLGESESNATFEDRPPGRPQEIPESREGAGIRDGSTVLKLDPAESIRVVTARMYKGCRRARFPPLRPRGRTPSGRRSPSRSPHGAPSVLWSMEASPFRRVTMASSGRQKKRSGRTLNPIPRFT